MAIPVVMHPQKPIVIVVGGGPVALMVALGLTRANMDFVLLEQRKEIVIEDGSDLTLLPMKMRALDQLDLLRPLSNIWNPVCQIARIDHKGRTMSQLRFFKYLKKSTGYYPSVLSRRDLLHAFYRALPKHAQDRILTNKKVSNIQNTHDGVTVKCTDGTAYDGTFVIGADGCYGVVQRCMRDLSSVVGSPYINENEPFITAYHALWVRFPTARLPFYEPGTATETHGLGIATQLFTGENTSTVAVYRRLPEPTRRPSRYDERDQKAMVKEWGHLPLLKEGAFRLKDAYEARLSSGLVNLEEGVLSQWSWGGRIVLVGDAAHKFTTSTGSGLNYGIADAVALMNVLHELSQRHGDNTQNLWSQSSLSEAFETYQAKRLKDVTAGYYQASGATAMATWASVFLGIFDRPEQPSLQGLIFDTKDMMVLLNSV